jgi:hypothetical protein
MITNGNNHQSIPSNTNIETMPIYSQVPQKNTNSSSKKATNTNSNNRNLVITNGATNADSWV